ncbi:class I SAM-dependent methyltransferase [Micropruina sp.]|uniref:class I SAM-dependent methyltransferase n=1 Tax=Micropruina sp. TaxID=2737536 RepID=UPI0039E2413C
MTDTLIPATGADQALKQKHRAMWASGDYGAVAREVIPTLGASLVEACGVRPGDRVLDVAAGTGNAAVPAARRGTAVVASDLTPELLAEGARLAAIEDLRLEWEQGDAEALPYADGSFDVVLSCVGVMFAPHHAEAASELLRVCRPGGTIGLISWTPAGFIGQLFATVRPFVPAPPPGVQPAPRWGDPDYVTDLFGDGVTELRCERRMLRVDRFATGAEFRDFFRDNYGPTLGAYRNVGDDAVRRAELDVALAGLADDALIDGAMDWEYLVVTARRAG